MSVLCLLCASFGAASVQADTVFGIYAGAGSWQQQVGGDVRSGVTDIDIENDLGIDDDMNNLYYVALEHPVPGIPNIRAQYTNIAVAGSSVLSRSIEFNGTVFDLSEPLSSDVDLTQADLVLYYEILDNVVSLDVGIAARFLDGYVSLVSAAETPRAEFKGVIPMVYGRTRMDLPFTGFWLGAEITGVAYDGNQLFDANGQIGWESPVGLGAEAGWRMYQLELDNLDDINSASVDISGPYFALNYHF